MNWIKLSVNVFFDEKIRELEKTGTGERCVLLWFRLLCLAGKRNEGGYLTIEGKPMTLENIASALGKRRNFVTNGVRILKENGLIGVENDAYYIPGWVNHQSADALDKIRENNRLRQKRYRENHKEKYRYANVTVTQENKNKKKEEEKEVENKNMKETPPKEEGAEEIKSSWKKIVEEYCLRFEGEQANRVSSLLCTWLSTQKEKGKVVAPQSLTLSLEKIQAMAKASKLSVEDYIKEVVCRGWNGFYPIPAYQQPAPESQRNASYSLDDLELIVNGRGEGQ